MIVETFLCPYSDGMNHICDITNELCDFYGLEFHMVYFQYIKEPKLCAHYQWREAQ